VEAVEELILEKWMGLCCNVGVHKNRFIMAILLPKIRKPELCILLTSQEK